MDGGQGGGRPLKTLRYLLAATGHIELQSALEEAGARLVSSAAALDEVLQVEEPIGIFVSQEVPGLTVERVIGWAHDRPKRVGVWLEDRPPPAWRSLPQDVVTWQGELAEDDLERWATHLLQDAAFGDEGKVLGALNVQKRLSSLSTILDWSRRLEALRGPGTLVDADWDTAQLTGHLYPQLWRHAREYSQGDLVRYRRGWLLPAPPPWEIWPREPTRNQAENIIRGSSGWILVDLGHDLRRPLAARWGGLCDHIVMEMDDCPFICLDRMLAMVRDLNPHAAIAIRGDRRPLVGKGSIIELGSDWPRLSKRERGEDSWKRSALTRFFGRAKRKN